MVADLELSSWWMVEEGLRHAKKLMPHGVGNRSVRRLHRKVSF